MTSQKQSSRLALYRDYVSRTGDRLDLFRTINERFAPSRVLYAGSYIHITPSLVFAEVTYVDSDRRTRDFFSDASVLRYVEKRRLYQGKPVVRSFFGDYNSDIGERDASFDLLISQYAGFVSQACKRYLRKGGHLLVNNSHGDAAMAHADPDYELAAVVSRCGRLAEAELDRYFETKEPRSFTMEQIASLGRGVRYVRPAPHYVFRRI